MIRRSVLLMMNGMILVAAAAGEASRQPMPVAEVEDVVYTYTPADNGAGPMWGNASSCIVRTPEGVFASGIETLPGVPPLNNVRALLFRRDPAGWSRVWADPDGRTREPCPLGYLGGSTLLLSVNPTLTELPAHNGPAEPRILAFDTAKPDSPGDSILPDWNGNPPFTEHSYRSFAADAPNRSWILFQNIGYTHAEYAFHGPNGTAAGRLTWPWGAEYEEPQPIRVCYPAVALRNRATYFCGVSDIVEPKSAWRAAKKALTGRDWDYDFRRLFFTWSPDVTAEPFRDWIEVATREETCGWIFPCDIRADADGTVHLLWSERALDERLRDAFYPDARQTHALHYARIRDGRIEHRVPVAIGGEGESPEIPGVGRFHTTEDGRLFVLYYTGRRDADDKPVSENRILEILPDGTCTPPVPVPLRHPFGSFVTAGVRGGNAPSSVIDVLGHAAAGAGDPCVRYARIELFSPVRPEFAVETLREPGAFRIRADAARSTSATGAIVAMEWEIGDARLRGVVAEQRVTRGGPLSVRLTVTDDLGNRRSLNRTICLPPLPADLGLDDFRTVLRTEAEGFAAETGGTAAVRSGMPGASALTLALPPAADYVAEWDLDVPATGEYMLVIRYAADRAASRSLRIDGENHGAIVLPASETGESACAVVGNADGEPRRFRLTEGKHRFALGDADGTALEVDAFDWVGGTDAGSPAPPPELLAAEDPDGYRYLIPARGTLPATRVRPELGHAFTVQLGPHYPGDGVPDGAPSTLRLFEDERELGPAHVLHREIREQGEGRFSHWRGSIWFSASDNSDPRTNGRTYTWVLAPP